MKTCTRCQTLKELAEFRKSTRGPLQSWCRQCEKDYQKKIYADNPKKSQERSANWRKKYAETYSAKRKENRHKYYASEIARKYNMTKSEASHLIKTEGSRCKACSVEFDLTKPLLRRNLDHCHKTGKVRGFLCLRCNTVAGLVNDDTTILKQIAKYLKRCMSS